MLIRNLRGGRRLAALAIFAVVALSAFGFAEANTFNGGSDAGKAGDGAGVISGYNITNISYALDANNPNSITGVAFTLDGTPTTVRAWIGAVAATSCSGPGSNWTCTFAAGTVATQSAVSLRVAAAD